MNKVTLGVHGLHYALMGDTGIFETPIALPGVKEISFETSIEDIIEYADDTQYIVLPGSEETTGTLTILDYPESYMVDVLGRKLQTNKSLTNNGVRKNHALFFKRWQYMEDGSKVEVLYVYYNCKAGKPTITATTIEATKEAQPLEIPLTAFVNNKVLDTDNEAVSDLVVIQSTATEFFFEDYGNKVPLPTDTAPVIPLGKDNK